MELLSILDFLPLRPKCISTHVFVYCWEVGRVTNDQYLNPHYVKSFKIDRWSEAYHTHSTVIKIKVRLKSLAWKRRQLQQFLMQKRHMTLNLMKTIYKISYCILKRLSLYYLIQRPPSTIRRWEKFKDMHSPQNQALCYYQLTHRSHTSLRLLQQS